MKQLTIKRRFVSEILLILQNKSTLALLNYFSGVASAFLRSIKLRKKVRKNWGKMEENNRGMRTNEEMFLSCPPEVESLATPLMVFMIKRTVGKSSNHHSTSEMVDAMYIFFIDVSISKAVICMEHVNNFW